MKTVKIKWSDLKKISFVKFGVLIVILNFGIISCIDLKSVNNYSSSSLKSIKKFEEIKYSFSQHCQERCQFDAIRKFDIQKSEDCHCKVYMKADSVTMRIYNSINGYLNGLANLSKNDLTDYNFDVLNKSLKEGTFGDIKIDSNDVNAYSKISKILLKATTDIYRKKQLKLYVEKANKPIQVLLNKFEFIVRESLYDELNFKKEKNFSYYKEMSLNKTLSDYEIGKATIDYYQNLNEINQIQKQIEVFSKSLNSISEGHQKLYDARDKMNTKEIKETLTIYASNIQDLMTEFNKLKK